MNEIKRFETWSRYRGSNWDYEHAVKYILQLDNENIIEAGFFTHFNNGRTVKSVIELPSSSGCPMKCKFCASSSIPFIRKLSVEEELLVFNHIYQREMLPVQSPLVVSFTGIGDIFFTLDTVEKTIIKIANIHNGVQFTVSSCHWIPEMFRRIEKLYSETTFRAIQITYISYKKSVLHNAISYYDLNFADSFSFEDTIRYIDGSSIPKFRINYLLLNGINDSQEDFLAFLSLVMPIKDKILVRISKLNITKASVKNQISESTIEKMEELKTLLKEKGIQTYLFYAMDDDGLGCGQLLSETNLQDSELHKKIME